MCQNLWQAARISSGEYQPYTIAFSCIRSQEEVCSTRHDRSSKAYQWYLWCVICRQVELFTESYIVLQCRQSVWWWGSKAGEISYWVIIMILYVRNYKRKRSECTVYKDSHPTQPTGRSTAVLQPPHLINSPHSHHPHQPCSSALELNNGYCFILYSCSILLSFHLCVCAINTGCECRPHSDHTCVFFRIFKFGRFSTIFWFLIFYRHQPSQECSEIGKSGSVDSDRIVCRFLFDQFFKVTFICYVWRRCNGAHTYVQPTPPIPM